MKLQTVPITYSQITINYGPGNKKNVFCALPHLEPEPLRDEMLEEAVDQGFIDEGDLNFECAAVEIEEDEYLAAVQIQD